MSPPCGSSITPARRKGDPRARDHAPDRHRQGRLGDAGGETKILSRIKDPVWIPPVSVRKEHAKDGDILPAKVPAGPDNPLGRHMFRLGWPSYLVHGTNKPYGVGMRSSHGCIRLYPEDIEILYDSRPSARSLGSSTSLTCSAGKTVPCTCRRMARWRTTSATGSTGPKSLRATRVRSRNHRCGRASARPTPASTGTAPTNCAQAHTGIPNPVMKVSPVEPAAVLAAAPVVRNALPTGATWDGNEDQYADDDFPPAGFRA